MTWLPFKQVKKISSLPIIPLYHAVSERPSVYVRHVNIWRSVKQFKKDIAFLTKHFEPVSLEDLYADRSSKKTPFHLTFDDGLNECMEWVIPILERAGIPATFFVNSAFVDNQGLFFRFKASIIIEKGLSDPAALQEIKNWLSAKQIAQEWSAFVLGVNYQNKEILEELADQIAIDFDQHLKQQPCYMTLKDLKRLQSKGFSIGAHSIDHPKFAALSLDDQLNQALESLRFVTSQLSPTIRTFAFPFTDYRVGPSFFKKLSDSGCCDLSFGCAGLKKETVNNHFQRIPFDEESFTARQKLTREYLYYLMKMPVGKNTFIRHEG
jgi:peptidoglycan/xylan/chitin deacetylase (PgdA/CDA1 family)